MTIEIRTKALELAIEFSKGFNHHIEKNSCGDPGNKCNSDDVIRIAKKFEDYMKGN